MLKTLLATTALTAALAFGAAAQNAPEPSGTMAPQAPATGMAAEPTLQEGWSEVDIASLSTDTLIGTDIRTYDQQTIASVQDVILGPDGKAQNVVARFGGFLGFGETTVLLDMDEVTFVKDADGRMAVLTSLTAEALKDRPEYQADRG